MAIKILAPQSRGLMENEVFKGHTVFSNGMTNTPRPDAFGTVYVFNDDILYPKSFLGMHPHKNVEIVTIMLSGIESHKDTLGVHENYSAGDVQLISSGTGVLHEGGNVSDVEDARHLQIWIAPKQLGLVPKVQVKKTDKTEDALLLVVSPNSTQQSLKINQEVWIYKGKLTSNQQTNYQVQLSGNGVMIYLIEGILNINSVEIQGGCTAFVTDEDFIEVLSKDDHTTFVLIDTVM